MVSFRLSTHSFTRKWNAVALALFPFAEWRVIWCHQTFLMPYQGSEETAKSCFSWKMQTWNIHWHFKSIPGKQVSPCKWFTLPFLSTEWRFTDPSLHKEASVQWACTSFCIIFSPYLPSWTSSNSCFPNDSSQIFVRWLYWSWLDDIAESTFSLESWPKKLQLVVEKQNKNTKSKSVKTCIIWIMPPQEYEPLKGWRVQLLIGKQYFRGK